MSYSSESFDSILDSMSLISTKTSLESAWEEVAGGVKARESLCLSTRSRNWFAFLTPVSMNGAAPAVSNCILTTPKALRIGPS